jgi:hypothetical protein
MPSSGGDSPLALSVPDLLPAAGPEPLPRCTDTIVRGEGAPLPAPLLAPVVVAVDASASPLAADPMRRKGLSGVCGARGAPLA